MIHGVLNVYKEKGYTSHDVVAKLRGIVKQKKIGHTGTLDPDAEGVLPVCFGKATKLCDLLTDKDKTYEAVLLHFSANKIEVFYVKIAPAFFSNLSASFHEGLLCQRPKRLNGPLNFVTQFCRGTAAFSLHISLIFLGNEVSQLHWVGKENLRNPLCIILNAAV